MPTTVKKETRLVNKIKCLLKRVGVPRWLHHYGPKTYEFWNHVLAYVVKQECKLGYRRVTLLLRGRGVKCPGPSALCMSFNKIPLPLWQRLLAATAGSKVNVLALDGSGLSRPLPSPYYCRRVDKPYPVEIPLKFSLAVNTRSKKILAVRLRSKKAHDIKDFKYLIERLPKKPRKIVADKAYDANWVHEFYQSRGIHCHNSCKRLWWQDNIPNSHTLQKERHDPIQKEDL